MPACCIYVNVDSISQELRLSVKACWLGELAAVRDGFVDIVLSGFLLRSVDGSGGMAVQDALKLCCMVSRLVDIADAIGLVGSV